MAAPARAAPRSGPAFSPHENALRLSLEPPLLRLLDPLLSELLLLRFEVRPWVRVAINSSLAGIAWFNGQGRGRVPPARPASTTARREFSLRWCPRPKVPGRHRWT